MICTSKTFSIHTVEGSTFLIMRLLILLFVIALFAPVISAQSDAAYLTDDIQYYTEETQDHPDETQYYNDATEYNPDKPIVVASILGPDDDATACRSDTHPNDCRVNRACCLGSAKGRTPDGGYLLVYKCRRCTFCFLPSNNLLFF